MGVFVLKRDIKSFKTLLFFFVCGGGGGTGRSESSASRTTFYRLPYLCSPLPPDSHPSLCFSRLQVNQEDQKPGFNFQTVPKLNIVVHFLAFFWRGDHRFPMKVITGQFS